MPFINYATKSIAIKIVYYGPGLSGKTTNLRYIYYKLDTASRGELICLETETDRTYFFDLLPIRAGMIGDFKVHFQLISAPGQVFYEASRKSVLRGSDGIVFVADSQIPLLDANLESFDGLRRNCLQNDIDLGRIPLVFQYNKRDLDYLIPVETFNNLLNPRRSPWVEAMAVSGVGVFETLREISKLTVPIVRDRLFGPKVRPGAEPSPVPPPAPDEPPAPRPEASRTPGNTTRVVVKSRQEIEDELERLSKEYVGK
jgi:mutual gliding-motility protein MglA